VSLGTLGTLNYQTVVLEETNWTKCNWPPAGTQNLNKKIGLQEEDDAEHLYTAQNCLEMAIVKSLT